MQDEKNTEKTESQNPMQIIRQRYACGEINKEEMDEMMGNIS